MLETSQNTATKNAPDADDEREVAPSLSASAPLSLTQSADEAMQSVGKLYSALDSAVSQHVRENPYATLAAAAGVGFVLGGGMRSPIGQVLMRIGVRAFGPPLVSAAVNHAVERAQGFVPNER